MTIIYVLLVAHFVQDAITSRINARLWFIETYPRPPVDRPRFGLGTVGHYEMFAHVESSKRHWFFVGVGADQLLHYIALFVTAGWWLR